MELCLAKVIENFDIGRGGTIDARIAGEGAKLQPVLLSSYYNTGEKGTIKSPVPRKGSTIIVCKPTGSKFWIYLATCDGWACTGEGGDPIERRKQFFNSDVDRGTKEKGGTGFDSDLVIQNDMGCGMELSQTFGTKGNKVHTKLYSGNNKYIKLNDSNPRDDIELNSGQGSSFRLTAFPTGLSSPSQGSVLDTVGPQRFINRNGKTCIMVQDGSELNFINNSTGFNCLAAANAFTAGNINIQSQSGDINLLTKSPSSKIFIECLEGEELGAPANPVKEIVIRAGASTPGPTNKVIIEASEIQLTAGNISILSNQNINVASTGTMNFTGGTGINFSSGGPINIDGATINLNSGFASAALTTNTPGTPLNAYGPLGVFQYF